MKVVFKRLSNVEHTLVTTRDDGSTTTCTLETRSTLVHDLVHWALESALGETKGFWGLVADGAAFDAVQPEAGFGVGQPELVRVERMVGPLQAVFTGKTLAANVIGGDLSAELVARTRAIFDRVHGHWRAIGFHDEMELTWPPDDFGR